MATDFEQVFKYGLEAIAGRRVVHLGNGRPRTLCGRLRLPLVIHPKKVVQTQENNVYMLLQDSGQETRLCKRCQKSVTFTEYKGKKVILFKRDGSLLAWERVASNLQRGSDERVS